MKKERKPGLSPDFYFGDSEKIVKSRGPLPKIKQGTEPEKRYDPESDPVTHLRKPHAKYRRVPNFSPARDAPSEVATLCGKWVALDKAVRHDLSLLSANVCSECMFQRDLKNVFGDKE